MHADEVTPPRTCAEAPPHRRAPREPQSPPIPLAGPESPTDRHATSPATAAPVLDLLVYQRKDVESPARLRWNCWARQTGKSFTKSLRRMLRGLARRRDQVFLSAGERQCRELMHKAAQHCAALKIAGDFIDGGSWRGLSVRRMEIVLPGGVRIVGLPANPQTARGFTGDVLLDEFAMHADDRAIWAALLPTILRGDGEIDVASTPKGVGNEFHELGLNPAFEHSIVTLPQAVEQGLRVDVEDIRAALGDDELYRQEFLCEFLDRSSSLLTLDAVTACQSASCRPAVSAEELGAMSGALYAGVDIGRLHDRTVIWVVSKAVLASPDEPQEPRPLSGRSAGASPVLRTVGIIELSSAPFARQWDVLASVLRVASLRRCCIDGGGLGMQLGEQAVDAFGHHRVEAVTFTTATKSRMALDLRRLIEERRIILPASRDLAAEFAGIRRNVGPTGELRLSAARGESGHADRFWAAALAVRAAGVEGGVLPLLERLSTAPARYAREGAW